MKYIAMKPCVEMQFSVRSGWFTGFYESIDCSNILQSTWPQWDLRTGQTIYKEEKKKKEKEKVVKTLHF